MYARLVNLFLNNEITNMQVNLDPYTAKANFVK